MTNGRWGPVDTFFPFLPRDTVYAGSSSQSETAATNLVGHLAWAFPPSLHSCSLGSLCFQETQMEALWHLAQSLAHGRCSLNIRRRSGALERRPGNPSLVSPCRPGCGLSQRSGQCLYMDAGTPPCCSPVWEFLSLCRSCECPGLSPLVIQTRKTAGFPSESCTLKSAEWGSPRLKVV